MRRWKRSDPCWIFTETDRHAPWKRAYRFSKDVYQGINRGTHESGVSQDDVARFLNILEHAQNPCLRCGGTILAMTGFSPADHVSTSDR